MRVLLLFSLLLTSCARELVSSPEPESILKSRPREKSVDVPGAEKSRAGKLIIAGLSPEQLDRIRVIPESGGYLINPLNQTYPHVDGFWWKGRAREWFKIPDYSEAWVGENPPESFKRLPESDGFIVAVRNNAIPSWVRLAMGKVGEPGWCPDEGATRSPVSSPWRP